MEDQDNFPEVRVRLTQKEYLRLRRESATTGEGTLSAAIRKQMGLHEIPYGWAKFKKALDHKNKN